MKRALLLIAATSLTAIVANTIVVNAQSRSSSSSSARAEGFTDHYGILSDKNIFVRNRPATRTGSRNNSSSSPSDRPRRAEESLVLTGIALQEGRNVAFIENTGTHTTERVVQGASVAGGKITDVKLDSLEFETGGQKVRIAIGRNLLGDAYAAPTASTSSSSSSSSSGSTTAPSTGAANSAGGGGSSNGAAPRADEANLSVVERMKRARERALGK